MPSSVRLSAHTRWHRVDAPSDSTTSAAACLGPTGTFVFALNGALTAVRAARLDVVGVVTLGMMTALGGGVIRDLVIGDIPPATFRDWHYFALAVAGGLVAFALSKLLNRLETSITLFDALGLSVFAVIGTSKAAAFGLGIGPTLLLGVVTAVGGGTLRDVLIGQIPTVLRSELMRSPHWSPRRSRSR